MYSSIINSRGAQVEQLGEATPIINLGESGGVLDITSNTVQIALQPSRVYEIHAIKLVITHFINSDLNAYAFPKFEQFDLTLAINAAVGSANNSNANVLFRSMKYATSDGVSNTWLFNEPFIFKTDSNLDTSLFIEFVNNGSVFISLTGLIVPPAAGQVINVNGTITLEGISWSSSQFEKLQGGISGMLI